MFVYKITNLINGKMYVGQTKGSLARRFIHHVSSGHLLYRAIKKYGRENFRIEALVESPCKLVIDYKEVQLIQELRTIAPGGYNIEKGGSGLKPDTVEYRKKMSANRKGKKHSPETRQLMSKLRKGRKMLPRSVWQGKLKQGTPIICVQTGEVFVSLNEAAKVLKLSVGNISMVLRGRYKHTKGLSFARVF